MWGMEYCVYNSSLRTLKLPLKGEIGKIKKKRKIREALVSLSYTEGCAIAAVVLSR